jgi:hypothetical protein
MQTDDRSFERITPDDLTRLARLSLGDLARFFARRPETGALYQDRLLALCLCQGAADHYVSGKCGVKDFDVWAFFRAHPLRQFPPRRIGHSNFGPSKFGRHPNDEGYTGRRIDIIGRSIATEGNEDPIDAIRRYLKQRRTVSATLLASRPVIAIHPPERVGELVLKCP